MADDGDKTEQPTGKRLSEAREKGNIPRSGEVSTAMTVLAMAGFLSWMGPSWGQGVADVIPALLGELNAGPWNTAEAEHYLGRVLWTWIRLTAPVVATIALVVVTGAVAQVGFVITTTPLTPNLGKLNILNGLKGLLGTRALLELGKAPLKLGVFGLVAWVTVKPQLATLMTVAGLDPMAGLRAFGGLSLTLLWRLGLAHLFIAVADYAYQKWAHKRRLRMTKEEVKEEMKQAEGDPQTRARFRSLHRQYAMKRMIAAVPTADVVVTNPTHLAVALRYDAASMKAPTVVAKGARLIAQRIRDAARAAGVPIIEHKPLAQALYKAVPVGHEIPGKLYRAVAEILAYVWALHRRFR